MKYRHVQDKKRNYKDLILQLIIREIKGKYKQSILGYAWVLLVPLLHLAVLSVVFSYFVKIPVTTVSYPIFLFAGLVPWMYVSNTLLLATGIIVANRPLITKIYLPREIFVIATVLAKLIDLLLTMALLFVILFFAQVPFSWHVLWFPIILIVQVIAVVGIALFLSALNVFYRDVEHVIGIALTMWMYLTPIIYPPDLIPKHLLPFFALNPMTGIVEAYRNILLYQSPPNPATFVPAIGVSVSVCVLGNLYFKRQAKFFADTL